MGPLAGGHRLPSARARGKCELEVELQDAAGGLHRGHEEFTTLFTSVDQKQQPELRYDPSDPGRFVVSWALAVTGGRVMAAVFFLVTGPVFLLGIVALARRPRGPAPASPPVPTEWR